MPDAVPMVLEGLSRSELYGLLAQALASPQRAADPRLLRDLARVASECEGHASLSEPARALQDRLEASLPKERVVLQEYTRLFHKGRSPPHEASYLPAMRTSNEIADVASFFRAFGFEPKGERADHLVSELEIMALLCLKEAIAAGNGQSEQASICRDAQAKFLRDHLGRWLAVYRGRLAEAATLDLYPSLVDLVRELVRIDARALGVQPEEITEVPAPDGETIPGCGVAR